MSNDNPETPLAEITKIGFLNVFVLIEGELGYIPTPPLFFIRNRETKIILIAKNNREWIGERN